MYKMNPYSFSNLEIEPLSGGNIFQYQMKPKVASES